MAGCGHCDPPLARSDRFRRVLWVALIVNASMFVVELAAGWISGSMALQADALDFLGDSLNYALSLVVVGMGLAVRARAALVKAAAMGLFGLWVLASTVLRAFAGAAPEPQLMGAMGVLALASNVAVAALLFRYREGDANMRSIWLCSRNDALGNVAVILAASGVAATGTRWPDLVVAAVIAALALHAARDVFGRARAELAVARRQAVAAAGAPIASTGMADPGRANTAPGGGGRRATRPG